jgi:cysteinyl-tRNA synthetase
MSAKEYFRQDVTVMVQGVSAKAEVGSVSVTGQERIEGKLSSAEIEKRIEARRAARARKDFAEADRIRKELDSLGILLEDSKAGTTWKYKS